MRFSPFALLAGAVALASAETLSEKEEISKEDTTTSDGLAVPALLELTPTNWQTELKKSKFIMIKHFSPYCPHCIDFAPTFQSIYEFYYNSKPTAADAAGQSFTEYYDFRFGIINCIAYYDLCMEHAVQSYPTSILYEDGEVRESMRGVKTAAVLSTAIEAALNKYKPGTRPESLDLPEVKDENAAEKKKEAKEAWKKLEAERKEKEEKEAEERNRKKAEEIAAQDDQKTEKVISDKKTSEKSLDDVTERPGSSEEASKSSKDGQSTESKSTKDTEKLVTADDAASEKKFGADWKVPTTGEMLKKTKPKEPATIYNQEGISTPLTPETFNTLVTSTQDPWFIKFYAPWCSHCRAMAPAWTQMAKEMAGKLNVGEVNCDAESKFCKEMGARAYPTVRFYRGAESADYRGLRGVGDFVQYAEKALEVAVGIPDITSKTLKEMEKEDDVIFIYFYDHATTSEDFKALEQLPLNLIGHAKIVKTNDKEIIERFKITTFPRFLVSREGLPTYYTPITPDEMRDVDTLVAWMKSVWLPLVPELTANNARQIMEHKIVALAILNRDNEDRLKTSIQELKGAAGEWMNRQVTDFQLERQKLREEKSSRIQQARDRGDSRAVRNAKAIKIDMESTDRQEVAFAWIDGIFWARWLSETYGIDVKEGERVLIAEEDRKRFWDSTVTGNHIMVTRSSIMETLEKVVYGPNTIETKYTLSAVGRFFFNIRMTFVDRPVFSIGFAVILLFGIWTWIRRSGRSRTAFLFPRPDDSMGLKDGLLGQSMSTKSD